MAHMVQRPVAYAALLGLTIACAAAGLASFSYLSARLTAAPQVVAINKAELNLALEDAPWFALSPASAATLPDAPQIWLLTGLQCPLCLPVEARAKRLGVEVKVLVTAPRTAPPAQQRALAELARRRSAEIFESWRARPDQPILAAVGLAPGDVGPAAVAGYSEWSHASFDRLAEVARANGTALTPPALFWRSGREWHMAVQPSDDAFRVLRRDLAAAR